MQPKKKKKKKEWHRKVKRSQLAFRQTLCVCVRVCVCVCVCVCVHNDWHTCASISVHCVYPCIAYLWVCLTVWKKIFLKKSTLSALTTQSPVVEVLLHAPLFRGCTKLLVWVGWTTEHILAWHKLINIYAPKRARVHALQKFLGFNVPEMANYTHLAVETRILMVFSLVFRASTRNPDVACIFFWTRGYGAHTPLPRLNMPL